MKISSFSLSYAALFRRGEMDVFRFLALAGEMGVEGASVHMGDLGGTEPERLRKIRSAYLENGLSVSLLAVSTDFGRPPEALEEEVAKAREAVRVASFLGAPLVRVFAGSPVDEAGREAAFERAAKAMRRVCEEAVESGMAIGLQNHNHGGLCRTGADAIRFFRAVNHPNFTFVLDTGQFAGCRGASGKPPPELIGADFMESIRETASLARYVRCKFYEPRQDGSEPAIDYRKVLDILRGVHYQGFIDVVYEPNRADGRPGEDARTAIPRAVSFLRSEVLRGSGARESRPSSIPARYAGLATGQFFAGEEPRTETQAAFLEGPAAGPDGAIYFSEIAGQRILKWDPARRTHEVTLAQSNGANGLEFDAEGRLIACERDRVTRRDLRTGDVVVLADRYRGQPLGEPNDLVLDGKGRIYFTARTANEDRATGNVSAVYRIDAPGEVSGLLAYPQVHKPNGLALSPDQKTFYLIDADGRESRARMIRAYDLAADGSVANERLLYDFYPGRSGDGMAVDAEGNLYVAAGLHRRRGTSETLDTLPGIHVITPAGKLVAFIETPEDTVTNCAFGGAELRTLYITCGKQLLSVQTRMPGMRR